MISKEECINRILNQVPEFQPGWEAYIKDWDYETPGLCFDIAQFADYVVSILENANKDNLRIIFDLVEVLMIDGVNEVKDAISTCFLENLLNRVLVENISTSSFIELLGEESKKYCLAWNEFTIDSFR